MKCRGCRVYSRYVLCLPLRRQMTRFVLWDGARRCAHFKKNIAILSIRKRRDREINSFSSSWALLGVSWTLLGDPRRAQDRAGEVRRIPGEHRRAQEDPSAQPGRSHDDSTTAPERPLNDHRTTRTEHFTLYSTKLDTGRGRGGTDYTPISYLRKASQPSSHHPATQKRRPQPSYRSNGLFPAIQRR